MDGITAPVPSQRIGIIIAIIAMPYKAGKDKKEAMFKAFLVPLCHERLGVDCFIRFNLFFYLGIFYSVLFCYDTEDSVVI